ncbi:MAG: tRNA 2-selenouridine(34) synthase MnmH [Arcobacter sp.]|uniref:tRNA 2-selenouridine(34) synthase MnmH n=1 Tax=Arcobacter sp. TaxID=1872629 RepID=UPI003C77AC27
MTNSSQTSDFKSLVLSKTPLIDVRAPIEFKKGSFPHAINLPLITDEERHLIGIKYKNYGNKEAVTLGHKLVSGEIKENRINAWLDFKKDNPSAILYCFRGGQRSKIAQEWISEYIPEIKRLKGGYKAFRNYLMNEIDNSPKYFKPLILGGHTGSGKTILLNKIQNSIDLEGLANHRGSTFGKQISAQPAQIDFENSLAYELIEKVNKGFSYLLFEDEGKYIGSIYIPKNFAQYLSNASIIVLETSFEERINITFNEYILKAQINYKREFEKDYFVFWINDMRNAMERIEKRLGSMRHKVLKELFSDAIKVQEETESLEEYKYWIAYLLKEYYDPMYKYQLDKNKDKILFKGSASEIINYLETLENP